MMVSNQITSISSWIRRRLPVRRSHIQSESKLWNTASCNLLFVAGLALVTRGAWMIYKPLGVIVAGLFCLWVGLLLAMDKRLKS